MITDPTIARIGEGVELHHQRGQREAARDLFTRIWDDIGGGDGDPLHVCVLAHAMADVQDEVHDELAWDLRALAAADLITDERVAQAGVTLSVAGLYPSLHVNVGDCYRKLGDFDRAREHLQLARDTIGALGDDEYGQLIGAAWSSWQNSCDGSRRDDTARRPSSDPCPRSDPTIVAVEVRARYLNGLGDGTLQFRGLTQSKMQLTVIKSTNCHQDGALSTLRVLACPRDSTTTSIGCCTVAHGVPNTHFPRTRPGLDRLYKAVVALVADPPEGLGERPSSGGLPPDHCQRWHHRGPLTPVWQT